MAAVAAVTLLAVIGLAAFTGHRVGASGNAPADDSADAGFSRDMQTHHNQAVELSLIVRDRTTDPDIRSVAYDKGMGMATAAHILTLKQASAQAAERQFLILMIAHHRGGVTMAQAALDLAERPEVRTLAQAIHTSQRSEIRQLEKLLTRRQ